MEARVNRREGQAGMMERDGGYKTRDELGFDARRALVLVDS